MILCLRTDNPLAEVLLVDDIGTIVKEKKWQAHRILADTLLSEIIELVKGQNATLQQLQGVVVYKGPGSFTGLRIGATVANALADSLKIPIVGANTEGWLEQGAARLRDNHDEKIVMPEYGGEANITPPRK